MADSSSSPSSAPPLEAVLCDLDGVVRHWDDSMERVDRAFGLAPGTTARVAFAPERLLPAITGRISDDEWRDQVADGLVEHCGSAERARKLVAEWSEPRGRIDQDVLAFLASVRPHLPVVLVTNQTTRLESDLAALGLAEAFDAVVNSARVGFAKPDPRIYTFAARRTGAAPGRCLFVDDTPRNVETARELGMIGHHYTDLATLHSALRLPT
ncbi:MAG TPA: HAD family phosphatase [Actinopolymorphaceae bacterium]